MTPEEKIRRAKSLIDDPLLNEETGHMAEIMEKQHPYI
jgi:hypothetical protein